MEEKIEEGIHRRKRKIAKEDEPLGSISQYMKKENPSQELATKKMEEYTRNLKERQLGAVNLELEEKIAKLKKRNSVSPFIKKIKILFSSYLFTYKSLSVEKIFTFWIAFILGILFLFLTFNAISNKLLITVPRYGGTWNEGVIGSPRHLNPVLAVTDRAKDLDRLIFAGLLRKDKDGNLINDMASELQESEDGLSYTVKINEKARFHDGEKLTSEDVIFTIAKIQDKDISSPLAINFEGVTTEKVDDSTIIFHLKKPFIYFKEYLTFGILPKHLLENLSSQEFAVTDFNDKPIGSGPYKILESIKDSNGIAKEYKLVSNRDYIKGRPFLDNINIYVYQNSEELLTALNNGTVEATTYLEPDYFAQVETKHKTIISSTLPNIYSLSFNPNKNNIFSNKDVRLALADSIDKQNLVNQLFAGYATKKDFFFGNSLSSSTPNLEALNNLNGKEITISTADIDQLRQVANKIAEYWTAKGLKVNVAVYNLSEISDIIKNRNFEVLLFGSIIEHDSDLYAYWHSSQRTYPGLNVTGYASKNIDDNLDILKRSIDENERSVALEEINHELIEEMPSVPLYSYNLNYLVLDKNMSEIIKNKIPNSLSEKNERFVDIYDWYKKKEKVWRFTYKRDLVEKLENLLH